MSGEERQLLTSVADGMMKDFIPCTACRYCCDGCPMGLNIPMLLQVYNDLRFKPMFTVGMRIEGLPEEKRPSACIGCKACEQICPQGIQISELMKDCTERLKTVPKWVDLCREREEAAARVRNSK